MDRGYGENLRPYAQSSNQDQSYGGNWGNVNPGENKHSKQDVMNCEIGMWNPNTYNANKQPGSESNSAYGGSTTSNIPGSSSWYDTTAYAPNLKGSTGTASSYDMERVADSLTNINFSNMQQTQQSPWGDCGFNYDLYKDAPYYGNSQPNTNYLPAKQSSNPHSYTTSRNLQQSQQQNAALTNTASRSDGIDWRKPPASNFPGAVDPYYREADYTGSSFNQRSYEPAVQKPFATEWDKFTNPLNEVTDEDGDSAESLVKQMRDSANTSSAKFEETMKKPTSISKAALALLHDDLNTAAAPFQSSEKLKQYRNEHLGITVDQEPQSLGTDAVAKIAASSSLSVDAKEFVPNFKKQIKSTKDVLVDPPPESSEASSEHETIAINHMDDCINKLTVDPASFDVVVPDTLLKLRSLHISTTAISVIVDKIYEMCVVEPNFRYLGSQLCDIMSRSTTGLKHFRKTLLTKAQNEFGDVETKLKDDSVSQKRAQDFTHFMAELFLSLMAECADGKLERFQVLGRATFGVVGKLVDHPNDGNVQCAVRVLKLTVIAMQDSLKNDGRNSINKIEDILDKLTALLARAQSGEIALKDLTKNLLSGLIALRAKNWGRVSPEESYPGTFHDLKYPPVALPENDENYYMVNEPVFFTPDGVQYTAADAADSDFYQKYLARYSVSHKSRPSGHEVASDLESCYSNPMDSAILSNDSSYPNWSLGDADQYDSRSAEDDYDEELEAFMRRL